MIEIDIVLSNNTYQVKQVGLKKWLELEGIKDDIKQYHGSREIVDSIVEYVSTASDIDLDWRMLPWYEVVEAFSILSNLNAPTIDFPFLRPTKKKKELSYEWNYEERDWYLWANILASAYSWKLSEIAVLSIDDAIGLVQEIMVDDHLDKEFRYSLSEFAYKFDSSGKGTFVPMGKPDWMIPEAPPEPEEIMMPKKWMPIGNVVRYDEDTKH